MNQTIYTNENWKLFIKTYFPDKKTAEAYEILAKELDLKPSSIHNQCAPGKVLPTWAKAYIFAFINSNNVTKSLIVDEVIQRIKNALLQMKTPPAVDLEIK